MRGLVALRGFRQFVHQLHDRRNGGVERLTAADIIGHFGNFMQYRDAALLISLSASTFSAATGPLAVCS